MNASIWIGLLIILVALLLIGGIFIVAVINNSPMGYEDSTGFHYGIAPADKPTNDDKDQ